MSDELLKSRINHETSDLILEARQAMTNIAQRKIALLKAQLAGAKSVLSNGSKLPNESQDYIDGLIEKIAVIQQSEMLTASILSEAMRGKHTTETDVNFTKKKMQKLT